MTNFERIKTMDIESLAEVIRNGISSDACDYCKYNKFHCDGTPCKNKSESEIIVEWLESEEKNNA